MWLFLLVLLVVIAVGAYAWWARTKTREAFQTFLTREKLMPTTAPCGIGEGRLRLLRACPDGDRRYGVEYGASGPTRVTIAGEEADAECAAFVWWWEERHTSTDGKGHTSTHYSKKRRVVGAIRLPHRVPSVSIEPEGVFTRWGIGGHGDMQLESEEFNRRFDVRTRDEDRELTVRLFAPEFQRFLLEMFAERHVELYDDVLLVAGDPPGRDGTLFGDVAELPGARRDAALVASRIPASFWRGIASTERGSTP